jgi:hypothetical protein
VEPFLRYYQGANPMAPFLFDDLQVLLQTVMKKFILPKALMMPRLVRSSAT